MCSFYHDPLQTQIIKNVVNFTVWYCMMLKSHAETRKSLIDLYRENELRNLLNTKVGAASHQGKNYIEVRPSYVYHL